MDSKDDSLGCGPVGCMLIAITALAVCMTVDLMRTKWQRECIAHGVAEYNKTTGEWEWSVPKLKEGTKEK